MCSTSSTYASTLTILFLGFWYFLHIYSTPRLNSCLKKAIPSSLVILCLIGIFFGRDLRRLARNPGLSSTTVVSNPCTPILGSYLISGNFRCSSNPNDRFPKVSKFLLEIVCVYLRSSAADFVLFSF